MQSQDLTRYAELIDNRASIGSNSKNRLSIIDGYTTKLRTQLNDPSLDERFVAKALDCLSEKDINDLADYVVRKAHTPGRAFVKLCSNVMRYRALD